MGHRSDRVAAPARGPTASRHDRLRHELTYVLDATQASETPNEHPLAVILIDDLPDELTADPAAAPGDTHVVTHTDTGQRSDVTAGSEETQKSAVMTAQPNSAASAGGSSCTA